MSVKVDGTDLCLIKQQVNDEWLMFCTLCLHRLQQGYYKGKRFVPNTFTTGCGNFKSNSIHCQVKSSHQHVFSGPQHTKMKPSGAIIQGFELSQDVETKRVKHIINECMYLAKKDNSLNSIQDRCNSHHFNLKCHWAHRMLTILWHEVFCRVLPTS